MLADAPIAVNTLAWHGYDLEVAFAEAAAAGVRCIEPALIAAYYPQMDDGWFSPANADRLASAARAGGLDIRSVGAHMDLGLPGARAGFRRRIEFAAALGARFVHTNTSRRENERDFLAAVDALIPVAEDAGITICLENPGDGSDNIVDSGRAGAELVERIGCPGVRLNYDFSNIYSYSRGALRPEQDYVDALPWAAHLHFKELAREGFGWRFVPIGTGITHYDTILRRLGPDAPPAALELPLRHHRGADWKIALDPRQAPVPLPVIRAAVVQSLRFVAEHLGGERPGAAPAEAAALRGSDSIAHELRRS
jgi:sugar phosphate isomerase/epimerase